MMRIDIATLFPEMCERVLDESIIGRARRAGKLDIHCHQIRDYTLDKQKRVDDTLYGGGKGMLMQADPIFRCYEAVCQELGTRPHVVYLSPQGEVFTQKKAIQLSGYDHLLLLCGHYEGVDQRVLDEIVDEEVSIGDYVLTGGELAALVVTDAVSRMQEGVLAGEECFMEESHWNGLLECPQYTHPAVWHGREVPAVLQSGHHANIQQWRREHSLENTYRKRPDLLCKAQLTAKDKLFLRRLKEQIKAEGAAAGVASPPDEGEEQ